MDQDNFKLGVHAANAGDYEKAQAYFVRYVQSNPHSEQGWLYLGHCLSDSDKRIDCYKRVLRINPSNVEAQRSLTALTQPRYSPEPYPSSYEQPRAPVRSMDQARHAAPAGVAKPQKRFSNTLGWIFGSVAGLVVCLGVVCYGITKLPPASPPPPTATPTQALPKLDATILPAPVTSAGAGRVCLGFWDRGIACLNESGWQTYTPENSELPANEISIGTFCPDGRLVVAHANGISLVRDGQWEHIPPLPEVYGRAKDLACTSEGQLWAAHYKGISRYVNGAWQTYDVGMLTTDVTENEVVLRVFAAPDGKIWAQTIHSVAMFTNEQWTVFEKGQGLLTNPTKLTLDFTGRPWVLLGQGAGYYENGSWLQFESVSPPITSQSISFDARGWLWMSSPDQGMTVFKGVDWSTYSKNTASLSSDSINKMTTDSLGRVWVATSYGLSVYDGIQWQTYRTDNSDLMYNRVSFVVVERDGPFMPPPIDKPRGSMIGGLGFENGDVLPQKRVELCVAPVGDSFLGATPCDRQPFHMLTTTDQQGIFVFEDVPPGYYWLVAESNNGWLQLDDEEMFPNNQVLILPGEQVDIGILVLVNE